MTELDYIVQLRRQGGGCAICHEPPTTQRHAWDHDHAHCPGSSGCPECVRGLLCRTCNFKLGVIETARAMDTTPYDEYLARGYLGKLSY